MHKTHKKDKIDRNNKKENDKPRKFKVIKERVDKTRTFKVIKKRV